MDILLLIADCLEDLAKGNPSPNAFKDRIEALRNEARSHDRPAGSDETAEVKTNEGGENAVG